MKIKTSITINNKILEQVDKTVDDNSNRSQFIENAIVYYLRNHKKAIRNKKDSDILNKHYKDLNKESNDVLSFQDY